MVVMLSSIGVPGLNGFVGEYLILIGSFLSARWWTVVAAAGVILAALYLLWAYQRVFHGEPDEDNRTFPELRFQEGAVLAAFIGLIVFIGVYPKPLLDRIEPSVDRLIAHVEAKTGEPVADARRAGGRGGGRVMLRAADPVDVRGPGGQLVRPVAAARARRRVAVPARRRRAHADVAAGAGTPSSPPLAAGAAGVLSMVAVGRRHRQRPVDARRRRPGVRHVRPVRHDHDLRRPRAGRADQRRLPPARGLRRPRGLRPVPRRRHRRRS